MKKDPYVEFTFYEVNTLLTDSQIRLLLDLVEREMSDSWNHDDRELMRNLVGLKSMLLSIPMELGKTLGEWIKIMEEVGYYRD